MNATTSARTRAVALVAALLLAPTLGHAQTKVKSGFNLFSPQQDMEIGQQSAAQAEQQLPISRDDRAQDFVNDIGQRLAANAPGPKFRYQFKVVNASDLNAFALPGGYIYLNRGIIESARNEGEVAGVLAHEIAHAALRHGTHNASKAYLTQAGIGILGGILGGKVGAGAGQIINAVGGFGLNAVFLKYSREAETQADIIGSQILAKTGYNPTDMVSFFQTLAKSDSRRQVAWLASHPAPEKRIETIQKEARILGSTAGPSPTERLNSVQASLRQGGPAPTSQQIAQMQQSGGRSRDPQSRSGSGRDLPRVEAPSRQMRTYTNRGGIYQLQVPSNWEVVGENGAAVTFAPRGGAGEVDGRSEVVYGLIVNHYEPFGNSRSSRGRQTSIEEGTDDLIAQIRQSSTHLRPVRGSQRKFRLSGGTGLGVSLAGRSPSTGIDEQVTLITRQLVDGHLVYMLFVTPEADARNYEQVLSAIVQSFRVDDRGDH